MKWDTNNCVEVAPRVWLHVFEGPTGQRWTLSAGDYTNSREFAGGAIPPSTKTVVGSRAVALKLAARALRSIADQIDPLSE